MINQRVLDNGQEAEQGEPRGFFGRLWRNIIRPRIGAIVGMLVGGPLGAILGELIQQGVTVLIDGQRSTLGSDDNDEFPLTATEETILGSFIEEKLSPTIAALANRIDQEISSLSRLTSGKSSILPVDKVNDILQAIAVIRANNEVLKAHGERVYPEGRRSPNYVVNKVEAVEMALQALEQAVLRYVSQNNFDQYELALEQVAASKTVRIENMVLDWQGKTAVANKKVYVLKGQASDTQQTVETIETTNSNGDPVVVVDSPDQNAVALGDDTSKTKILKYGLAAVAAYLIYRKIKK